MRRFGMIALALVAGAAHAQPADDARGKRLFLQCQACHSVAAGQPHKVGPNLHGTMGAKAASRPGYVYSAALRNSKITWTDAAMDAWLAKPAATVPGNKMVYTGLAKAEDRAALIAYLKRATR
jgi:cytochrome c